ncbi:MAG TPA: EpsI family protein [Gemmatimonadales bacterium]|nr:EpsI family protein [Gemmatimonadales bacterium]
MPEWQRYVPALLFGLGCLMLGVGAERQSATPLAEPLSALPRSLEGYHGADLAIAEDEQQVAGMSSFVYRAFARDSVPAFTVYVGYYARQVQGQTIHSPKNCLPGAGWEVVASSVVPLATSAGPVKVNRYLLANHGHRALVYYWYQGRGRVEANEYRVKLELLRDAALRGRTEEALVRVVVPLGEAHADAQSLGARVSAALVPEIAQVLPT